MEVIRAGIQHKCTCRHCGSQLSAERSDFKLKDSQPAYGLYDDPEPEDYYKVYVVCPICHLKQ